MKSLWSDQEAQRLTHNLEGAERDLALRVYTSRLIGSDPDLVLHGGGNTSAKSALQDGDQDIPVMFIKGSGWDLGTIQAPGLPAVRLEPLLEKRHVDRMDDREMVRFLRANLLDQSAPTPSVEALLHAFLPAKFVDHTHATASLVLANQPNAAEIARSIFEGRLAIVPYVMPGFDLSIAGDKVFAAAPPQTEGLFLVNHGIFTVGEDARTAYERMIEFTTLCERHLADHRIVVPGPETSRPPESAAIRFKDALRGALADIGGLFAEKVALDYRSTPSILTYSMLENLEEITSRGTVTPDHVIRIKPFPLIAPADASRTELVRALEEYAQRYTGYFERNAKNATEPKVILDPLPRVVIVPGVGLFGLGSNSKAAAIAGDLAEQTARIVLAAEAYGRFTPISEQDLFDMEYWSLEQAKLQKDKSVKAA
ncbi:class II aldolase/adducin family protein [Microvirga sp. GCM10011540]|uniref:class II aldolase/adducin family protein n=1 Tax=Microvirga sp. GCM10011540 TaxID=3317338 RepID=UPI00360E9DD8